VKERGCQLSLFVKKDGKKVFNRLLKNNIIADWREPGVIRVAPAPLYNTFEEAFHFVRVFENALNR
jgi:kynureninase